MVLHLLSIKHFNESPSFLKFTFFEKERATEEYYQTFSLKLEITLYTLTIFQYLNIHFTILSFSVTLSETEKGNVPSIEHVGHPANIKSEMGNTWSATHRMKDVHFNWWNSSYLNERREYLKDVMDELDPHKPVSQIF